MNVVNVTVIVIIVVAVVVDEIFTLREFNNGRFVKSDATMD